jgi:hypothetical protein
MTSFRSTVLWIAAAFVCLSTLAANVSPQFTPVRSELAGARGFSRGPVNLVVLPSDAGFSHVPLAMGIFCAAGFLVLAMVRGGSDRRGYPEIRRASSTGVVLAWTSLALLTAVLLSPYLTPYRIVLAPRTFVLCLLCVYGVRAMHLMGRRPASWPPVAIGLVAAAFFAAAMFQTRASYDGNYSGFLHLDRDVAAAAPFLQERPDVAASLITTDAGYDGQFMYLMAFDPFITRFADRPAAYRAFIDNPPYRYGRIGFSVMTRLASAARPELFPAAMMWLIVIAHFALGTVLARIASQHGRSRFAALWYLAIPGFMSSLLSALPEALAAATLVVGVYNWPRRPWLAAAAFAAALLVRETSIVLIVAVLLARGRQDWQRSVLVLVAAILPVCAWRVFVATQLFPDFGWAAIVTNPGILARRFWE